MSILGFGGGPSGPSAEEMDAMRSDYWQTYSGWLKDEERSYAKKLGSTKARLAAGGVSSRSEGWKSVVDQLEQAHLKTMEGFRDTETYGQLKDLRDKAMGVGRRSFMSSNEPMQDKEGNWFVVEDNSETRTRREATPAEIEAAQKSLAERAMSTEEWYESRYGAGKATAAQEIEEEEQRRKVGMAGSGAVQTSTLAEQAKSPFAALG